MAQDNYMEKFMRGLKIAMVIKNISKVDLSKTAKINQSFLSRTKMNSRAVNPKLSTLMRISQALDMSLEDIISLPERAEKLLTK